VALRARIAELKRVADGVQEGLHRLAANLRPPSLDHLGLEAALRQHVDGLGSTDGPEVVFETAGAARWRPPSDVETALFRIAQEATTNALRHARASRIAVRLERRRDSIRLSVTDDGVGFDDREVNAHGRLGLIGMRERAEAVGGQAVVESVPGRGTTMTVEVPRAHPHRDRR
jgi:signal transduction histidine kinase